MSYATYSYTTTDKLIAEVKVELEVQVEDIRFKRWVLEAVKEMRTQLDTIQKTATLSICNLSAELPCDFVKFNRYQSITFTTDGIASQSSDFYGYEFYWTNGPYVQCNPYNSSSLGNLLPPVINIEDGKIWFSGNCANETEVTISYLALNLDEDGSIKIPEINSRPIIAYACYKYHRVMQSRPHIIQDYKNEWTFGRQQRNAQSKLPDAYQQAALSRIMNTLL